MMGADGVEGSLSAPNFGERPVEYTLPQGMAAGKLALANVPGTPETGGSTLKLDAWDTRVYTY